MAVETDLYWYLRHSDVIFQNWRALELSGFYVFLENDSTNLHQFFSGFRIKHFFITTCSENAALLGLNFTVG